MILRSGKERLDQGGKDTNSVRKILENEADGEQGENERWWGFSKAFNAIKRKLAGNSATKDNAPGVFNGDNSNNADDIMDSKQVVVVNKARGNGDYLKEYNDIDLQESEERLREAQQKLKQVRFQVSLCAIYTIRL